MVKGKLNLPLSFLRISTPPLVGVDIGSSAVKVVELAKASGGGYTLERYAIESLPKDAVSDGNINKLDVVSDAIRRAWGRLNTRIKNVCLALPASAVITKKILLPAGLNEDDLEAQVQTEASHYIPFAMEEVNLDFQVLGPAHGNAEEVVVLIAASRKANVEDRVAAAQSVGLKAVIMDVEPFAAQMAFEQIHATVGGADRFVALVDIGATVTNVTVLHNGESVYSRVQQIGGELLTRQIQTMYGLSAEEAEIGKRKGGLPASYEVEVLEPFRESIAAEVVRAIQFFYGSTPFSKIDHIILAGGGAALAGMAHAVEAQTEIDTAVSNPFAKMALSSRIVPRQLQEDAPSLLIACGLALRRFDPS
ncbi:MAG: pilus assembly protein PilM [Nitrosomonadales bacterium]|nr:pilus assembly protein PilM [Nitrosomonadales bacterium]